MMRHCSGTDPTLTRKVKGIGVYQGEEVVLPCNCGLTFDDVDYMTTYPHERV